MEDDVQYISVVFQNRPPPQTETKDEQTVYSEVNIKKGESAEQNPNQTSVRTDRPKEPRPPASHQKGGVRPMCVFSVLLVCLCVLLGSTAGLIYLSISTTKQHSENLRLSSEMSLLQEEIVRLKGQWAELQNLTHNLYQQSDQLNWTLQVILDFSRFPVSDFCPNKECRPCLDGWLLFQNSCYLFYEKNNGWTTWDGSQTYCKKKSAISGLVVINSIEEQEFIHANIKHYYDDYHGYWIGLSKQNRKWVWDDGREDTLGFWMKKEFGDTGPKALMIPNQNLTESWDPAKNEMNNKFICESKALIID